MNYLLIAIVSLTSELKVIPLSYDLTCMLMLGTHIWLNN